MPNQLGKKADSARIERSTNEERKQTQLEWKAEPTRKESRLSWNGKQNHLGTNAEPSRNGNVTYEKIKGRPHLKREKGGK